MIITPNFIQSLYIMYCMYIGLSAVSYKNELHSTPTPVAAGDSKNWGGQEENQHGILQQTASNYIIVPPDEIGGVGGNFICQ